MKIRIREKTFAVKTWKLCRAIYLAMAVVGVPLATAEAMAPNSPPTVAVSYYRQQMSDVSALRERRIYRAVASQNQAVASQRYGHAPIVVVVASASSKEVAFIAALAPAAATVSRSTGIDPRLVLAQWALESGWSTTGAYTARFNLAGITNGRKKFIAFSSLSAFMNTYIKIMNGTTYNSVRDANGLWPQEYALASSPWSETHYIGGGLGKILSQILSFSQ